MKHRASFIACIIIAGVMLGYRTHYSDTGGAKKSLIVTQWDAFGYYLYLPATFIYHDYKKLDWATAIDKQYNVTGGDGLPVQHLDNGNNVCKYLSGVAILQAPLFGVAHILAGLTGAPQDGFSPPYQYALSFGVILYCVLALLLLRRILLRYFRDSTVAITLLLLCLATNFIQYAAVHNGLSHAWIFPLYVLLLYATVKWHERPRIGWAFFIGAIIGLATICRPTEAVALFIPLLWETHTREAARRKWALVKARRLHVLYALLGGVIGVLPQLFYWKAVTGSAVYDVGSKWVFFNPWWRVLIGWEKGWFIYTPVTLLFVVGLFFTKSYPFRKAALTFCILTIWIVISWDDWRYGASYSTRALMQSYPVFALPLAAIIERISLYKLRYAFYAIGAYLIGVNLFQTVQYNSTILHYNDMNRRYYSRIYLNPHPSPLDMSLLDTDEWIGDERGYRKTVVVDIAASREIHFIANGSGNLVDVPLAIANNPGACWLKIEARIATPGSLWKSMLLTELRAGDTMKRTAIRLANPVGEETGAYALYTAVPQVFRHGRLRLTISSPFDFNGHVAGLKITVLQR